MMGGEETIEKKWRMIWWVSGGEKKMMEIDGYL
jgi:hypothetical protein